MKLSEYGVADYAWYVFSAPPGVTCVLQKNGGYGCSGPLPGAPNGANLVSGGPGPAGFANADRLVFGTTEAAKPLPAGSRISYQTVELWQRRRNDDMRGQPQPVGLRDHPDGRPGSSVRSTRCWTVPRERIPSSTKARRHR